MFIFNQVYYEAKLDWDPNMGTARLDTSYWPGFNECFHLLSGLYIRDISLTNTFYSCSFLNNLRIYICILFQFTDTVKMFSSWYLRL